jgi:hypothetical protein
MTPGQGLGTSPSARGWMCNLPEEWTTSRHFMLREQPISYRHRGTGAHVTLQQAVPTLGTLPTTASVHTC